MGKSVESVDQPVIKSEILSVAEMVSKEKGLEKEDIIEAMELAILKTAQLKYGEKVDLVAKIDRKTGETFLTRRLTVVDEISDYHKEISLEDAKARKADVSIGDVLEETLPDIDFGRISASTARQVIAQKVQEAERRRLLEEYGSKIGEVISGLVRRSDFGEIVVDLGRTECTLRRADMIPNESYRPGDRIKMLLVGINEESVGQLLYVSRTHPEFLKKLFEQEVPEIYDGIIKMPAVARDPGSKAKVAVYSNDPNIDPIGTCIGAKGFRVQAVSEELKGEKVDIVLWNDNPAVFIVNALSSVNVLRLVFDEETKSVDAIIQDDQLSLAIGRRGQNVRLASKITGWDISVISNADDVAQRQKENTRKLESFMKRLDVDEMVAHLLINEGFDSVEEIAETDLSELARLEGFNDEIAQEILSRALIAVQKKSEYIKELAIEKGVTKDLLNYEMISTDLLGMLIENEIKSLDDLGDLSTDELLDITKGALTKEEADTLIMGIRQTWFE